MSSEWSVRDLARPCMFIQWKGTDSCGDYYCLCGEQFHLDAEFAYSVQCPHCERAYEVSSMIEMQEITKGNPLFDRAKRGDDD